MNGDQYNFSQKRAGYVDFWCYQDYKIYWTPEPKIVKIHKLIAPRGRSVHEAMQEQVDLVGQCGLIEGGCRTYQRSLSKADQKKCRFQICPKLLQNNGQPEMTSISDTI